jgi:hypothetical protein
MPSGLRSADEPTLTVLCADLAATAANMSAIALGDWLTQGTPPRSVEIVSLWPGAWRDSFVPIGPVWTVNEVAYLGSNDVEPMLDRSEGRWAERHPQPWAVRAEDFGFKGTTALLQTVRLGHLGDSVRGEALRRRLRRSDGPIWLAGARGARLLEYAPGHRRVVAHLGEFDPPLRTTLSDPDDLDVLRTRVDVWVAGSERAAASLVEDGITAPIHVCRDLLLTSANIVDTSHTRAALAAEGLPADAPLVASSGELDWWDEPDLFVQFAWELTRLHEHAHLLWVAGRSTDRMLWPLRHDIRHAGLSERVHITPPGMRPLDALAAADVVAVTRRGVVSPPQVREVISLGVPVVRFAKPDEVPGRDGPSIVVPFLDERALAEATVEILADPTMLELARTEAEAVPEQLVAIIDGQP